MLPGIVHKFIDSFCRLSFDKSSGWQSEKSAGSEQLQSEDDRSIYCAACRELLTRHSHAIERDGSHQHRFINPAGITYDIVLFSQVNSHVFGEFEEAFSWFSSYAWRVALCPGCQQQIGWQYRNAHSPDFYGLIVGAIQEN